MVVEWFLELAATFVEFLAGLIPKVEIPAWLSGVDDLWNTLVDTLGGVTVWADWAFIMPIFFFVLLSWIAMFGVKVIFKLMSHVPQFGGNG